MENKFRPVTYIGFFVLIIAGIFIFSGCSTFSNWFSSSDMPANVNGIEKKEFKEFMTTVKPIHGDAKNQYRLARHFQKQGRHEIAVEEFIKALRIDPQYYNAYNALGVSYDCLRKFDLAQDSYRAALKLNSSLDYVYNNLGYSNLLKGDFQEAALAFEQAIVLNDQNKTYQNNLSLVKTKLGNEVQAEVKVPAEQAPVLSQVTKIEPAEKSESIEPPAVVVVNNSSLDEIAEETILQSKIEKNFYAVQLGAYTDINKAKRHLNKAFEKGYACPYITKVEKEKPYEPYYRVRFGKFTNKQEADSIRAAIIDKNGDAAVIIVENYPITVFCSDPQKKCTDMEIEHRVVNKEYSIEISNGNGVHLMARRVGNYLSKKGYNVKKISNASNFNHHQTTIYYNPGFYGQAQQLTQQIPGFDKTGRLVESNQIKKNIEVVIGKDIIPFAQDFKKTQKNS
jgi:Tfp pilus assembly protein PilF